MRIILGMALLAAGIGAVLLGLSSPPSWKTPELVARSNGTDESSRVAAISAIGSVAGKPAAAIAPVKTVPEFHTTLTVAAAPAEELADDFMTPALSADARAATDPATRAALARDIQVELARLGCYPGPIDGQWSPSALEAASLFVTNANATIPVAEPDFALLSLARAAGTAEACGPSIAAVARPVPAMGPTMGLGGPRSEAPKRPAAYHNDRHLQSLFTNPLGQ